VDFFFFLPVPLFLKTFLFWHALLLCALPQRLQPQADHTDFAWSFSGVQTTLGITWHKNILLSACGGMERSLQCTAASPSLTKTSSFVLYAWEEVFWPHMQKVLLFAPSPSCCTRADLVLPSAGEKGKLPGEWRQFSLLAAGRSVYWVGEGRTVVKLPAGFGGGCWESGWTAANPAGDTKLCPVSRWSRLLLPRAGRLLRRECQREPCGKCSLPATAGMAGHAHQPPASHNEKHGYFK